MKRLFLFIADSLKEINPWQNIKILHTNVRSDILAGITVAIIALPMALAFGDLAFGDIVPGAGPIAGIWGAIVGGIIGGLFGGCMVGVSGPTSPKALQIAGVMLIFSQMFNMTNREEILGVAFTMIFLSGLILIIISMLKISRFIHYTPYPVIGGFMCGIGVIVIFTQINAFLGLGDGENFKEHIYNTDINALYVSVSSLLILFLWDPFKNKIQFLSKIPSPLIALIVGSSIAYFMDLDIARISGEGMDDTGQDIFNFYIPNLDRLADLIWPAFSLAALAVLDSLLSCKVADNITGKRHSSDRETFGQGMANMAAGLLGGVTTATATMRTVGNIKFGAKTPLASIVHGLTLLAILLGLGPLIGQIPMACLAAILIKVGIDIMDYRIISILKNLPLADLLIFIVVLFFTAYFPSKLTMAVGIGIILALFISLKQILLIWKSSYTNKIIPLSESDFKITDQNTKKVSINVFQLQGPLFFGSMESILDIYAGAPKHEVLIIDMNDVSMVDLSGGYALEDLIKGIKTKGIKVFVSSAKPNVKRILEKINFIKNIESNYYKDSREFSLKK
ncbi:MAG: hypothetical protein CMG67_03290 [Candidatus Marinimicrobia bacterium]|nr:hypothetical protein [Candidatus Neomarinimicrobiota bacterium]|tara:strand:+ start:6862 stop:8556 length:1695 start_codon:yes stop_codon:yes gene_type:complete